ncbi:TetR/AcrR family transcriptional regulator [Amycolatopsis endophytica]|uniref:AcrR family transcriptional regulator n=1 Tax=Amycolatopsis endophytica TaxID=860233 RepID=A0A853B6S1_9PSEU|nr:TetR/AcrR family transcriptional regulator [Amycolatopsis endophytica]NYI90505.1 AcrR family transcriptional regulator [Amycolatopsis endophytica]
MTPESPAGARERILETAYELFSRRGVRAVGVDEVIARSRVAKATLYRHFPSKNDLVLAFLDRREQRWTFGLIDEQARARGRTAVERLLAVFDVLDDWFRAPGSFDGCAFTTVLLEMGADHPLGQAGIRHLDTLRGILADLASEAGMTDPDGFARSCHLLVKGAIISAAAGDADAAARAKEMTRDLLDRYRK